MYARGLWYIVQRADRKRIDTTDNKTKRMLQLSKTAHKLEFHT